MTHIIETELDKRGNKVILGYNEGAYLPWVTGVIREEAELKWNDGDYFRTHKEAKESHAKRITE